MNDQLHCQTCGDPLPIDGGDCASAKCLTGSWVSKVEPAAGKRLPPNAGKGRVAGVPNKTTRAAKEAIAFAAEGLGGAERLIAWAQEDPKNESAFWVQVYPKLLPLTVGGDADNPVKLVFGWMSEE